MTLKDRWNMYRQTLRAMNAQNKREKERRKQMKVYRTTEGTLFEVVCGALCGACWVFKLLEMSRSGIIDIGNLFALTLSTAVIVAMLMSAYQPHRLTTIEQHIENSRQLRLLVQSVRMMALLLAAQFMLICLTNYFGWQLPEWTGYNTIGLFIVVPLIYSILIARAK